MGYFKRKIDRRRCADAIDEAVERHALATASVWSLAPPAPPAPAARRPSYLRFAVGRVGSATRRGVGVFQATNRLYAEDHLSPAESDALRRTLRWFNRNLRVPRVARGAVFWFKSDATECLERVWGIIRVLDLHGSIVWMLRSERPGQVVYEDAHQLAALPAGSRLRHCRPVRGATGRARLPRRVRAGN